MEFSTAYVLVPRDILQREFIYSLAIKRNCTIYELGTVPLNSLYSASWDSLFSIVCICTFAQITKHAFWSIDVILWYLLNITLGGEQGNKTNVILLSKKIYETHKTPRDPVTLQIESAYIASCCANTKVMWENGYFRFCLESSVLLSLLKMASSSEFGVSFQNIQCEIMLFFYAFENKQNAKIVLVFPTALFPSFLFFHFSGFLWKIHWKIRL